MARDSRFNTADTSKLTTFSLKRKALASSYTSINNVYNYFNSNRGGASGTLDLTRITNGSQIDEYFRNIGSKNDRCIALSNALYDSNKIYASILDYLSNMFYFRYTVVPRRIKTKKEVSEEDFRKYYDLMLEYVDGVNIQTVFPELLLKLFKQGQIFLTVAGHSSAKAVSTMILPNKYCKPTFQTQYGTMEFKFDFTFFDDLGLSTEDLAILLERFPEEFADRYLAYKAGKSDETRWQTLDPRFSACIQLNEEGFPSYLAAFYDIIDYKTYKLNELDRNTNLLERLVVQEIDMERTGLDMTEVQELHDSMADIICRSPGTTLVTTVGSVSVEPLQEQVSEKNEVLQNSYRSIFSNAGLNDAIFTGDTTIDVNLKRDLSYVWRFVQKLEAFYNLALNHVKSFGPFQLSLKILDLSPYNETDKLVTLHQSATLGVGVLDYIVATGTKQVDLEATIELEEFLDLTSRLVPLQSSHTQSSTVSESKETGDDSEKTKDDNNKPEEPGNPETTDESSKEDSKEVEEENSEEKIKKGDN
jgi:hypothetical protein